ncbi:MAG: plasmid mobilization protein [Steroidobacteraceae bacterium]
MSQDTKKAQLQIRVTSAEKSAIHQAAKRAGMDMSAYVLSRVLSAPSVRFQECVAGCASEASSRFALAELNSLLSELTPGEMQDAVATPPSVALTPFLANYVAAMVEYGCARCSLTPPAWTRSVMPLQEPSFGTALQSLRLHLLTHSPPPFRLRNIFIDSSLGQRL